MPIWNSIAPVLAQKSKWMQVAPTFYNSTATTSTVTLVVLKTKKKIPFNEKKMGETICSVLWQIMGQGAHPLHPPPNTTGILQKKKKKLCGLLVLK